jgi:hypothetical protein
MEPYINEILKIGVELEASDVHLMLVQSLWSGLMAF